MPARQARRLHCETGYQRQPSHHLIESKTRMEDAPESKNSLQLTVLNISKFQL